MNDHPQIYPLGYNDRVAKLIHMTQAMTLRYAADLLTENPNVDPATFLRLLADDLERQTR